jgi:hypothetical protein
VFDGSTVVHRCDGSHCESTWLTMGGELLNAQQVAAGVPVAQIIAARD